MTVSVIYSIREAGSQIPVAQELLKSSHPCALGKKNLYPEVIDCSFLYMSIR